MDGSSNLFEKKLRSKQVPNGNALGVLGFRFTGATVSAVALLSDYELIHILI